MEDRTLLDAVRWINPAGGNWATPSNWSTGVLPGPSDDAIIDMGGLTVTHAFGDDSIHSLAVGPGTLSVSGGSLSLATASVINDTMNFSGGRLTGTGNLTVNGLLVWTGGTMSGTGTTTIATGGQLTISGADGKYLDGHALRNAGTATWTDTGEIALNNGSRIDNLADATFKAQNDANANITTNDVNGVRFTNEGSFLKSAGSGTTTFQTYVAFEHTGGIVQVQSGTLSLGGSGSGSSSGRSSAAFTVATGASVQFTRNNYTLDNGTTFSGGGCVRVTNGGTVTVKGANVTAQNFELGDGTVNGLGTLTVNKNLTWLGGTMRDAGTTTLAAGGTLAISGSNDKTLLERTLRNAGTATWTGTGRLYGGNDAYFVNEVGATFDAQNDDSFLAVYVSGWTFTNWGTFCKSAGNGPTTFGSEVSFNHAGGTVQVQKGTLRLLGGGISGGPFTLPAADAKVDFAAGTYTLQTGTSFSGAGWVKVANGTVAVTGTNVTAQNFELGYGPNALGIVTGPGTLRVAGTLNWTGGLMSGTGTTTLAAGAMLNISGTDVKYLVERTIDNFGTTTWTGGDIAVRSNSHFLNEARARFETQTNGRFYIDVGLVGGTFTNEGTFLKSGSRETTTQFGNYVAFDNRGTVDVQTGTLSLRGGGTSSGPFTLDTVDADVRFVADTYTLQTGTSFSGAGWARMTTQQAVVTIASGAKVTAKNWELADGNLTGPGTLTTTDTLVWTGGSMSGSGITSIAAGGNLLITGGIGGVTLNGRTLSNAGKAVWNSPHPIYVANDGKFFNQAGATFSAQNNASFRPDYSSGGVFTNLGTFSKTLGTGTTNFWGAVSFNNLGHVDVQTGSTLQVADGSSSGPVTVAGGATVQFTAGTYTLQTGASFSGAGKVLVANGTVTVTGIDVTAQDLEISSGTVNGPGSLLIPDGATCTWTGGMMSGSGITSIAPGGRLNIRGPDYKTLVKRTLSNSGNITWTGTGTFAAGGGSQVLNQVRATFDVQNDASFEAADFAAATFNNAGTFRKAASNGVTTFYSPYETFINSGTMDIQTGTMFLAATFPNLSGTTLTGGTYLIRGTLRLGNADIRTNAATLVLDGPTAQVVDYNFNNALANLTTNAAAGSFTLRNARNFTTNVSFTNAGTLQLEQGCNFTTLGSLSNTGTVQLGLGSITASGDFAQAAAGSVYLAIGGSPSSGQFGRLNLSRQANLGGTLNIGLINGFGPNTGQSFPLVNFGSHSGNFAVINGLRLGRTLTFTTTITGSSLLLNAITDAPDLAVDTITIPAGAVPGQPVTIGYTVSNRSSVPAQGNWVDSVYLASGSTLTPEARLIGRVQHVGGVGGGNSYSETLTAALPAVVEGAYRIIVVSDSAGLVPDYNRANNTGVSVGVVNVSVPVLHLGVTTPGTIANGQDLYYRLDVPPAAEVRLSATFTLARQAEMYVRYGQAPDRSSYDQTTTNLSDLLPNFLLSGRTGTYYVLLHGREGAADGRSFDLTPRAVVFQVTSVSPNHGSNVGQATMTVVGARFSPATAVSLISPSGVERAASWIGFKESTTLFATFNLTGLTPGAYDVRVVDRGQPATLPGAFTVTTGLPGRVVVNMSGPAAVRFLHDGTVTVEYVNVGDTDVPAPVLLVSADNALLRLPDQTSYVGDAIQVLGINHDGPAGTLSPGARGSITLVFRAPNVGTSTFTVNTLGAAETRLDWNAFKNALRPSAISAESWQAIYANFAAQAGATQGQYQALLDDNATYLSLLGMYTADVSRLLSFALDQANDSLPQPTLAGAIDATAPAPGPPLVFGRVYHQPISGRYRLGPLGRGWTQAWEIAASADANGHVTILTAGEFRLFRRLPDGTYQGSPGDHATLMLQDGTYRLRETNGMLSVFGTDGTLSYVQDTNGNRITLSYTNGQLTTLSHSSGARFALHYNPQGRIDQLTDDAGRITTYTYDGSGEHLLRVSSPNGTTVYTYATGMGAAREHALTSIAHPDNTHLYFDYDEHGRLTGQHRDGNLEPITYSYGLVGGFTMTNGAGAATTLLLNDLHQVAQVRDPLGRVTLFSYDADNNLVQTTAPGTIVTTYRYDGHGNLISEVDPLGHEIDMTYEPVFNELASLTDARGNTTRYAYDLQGNLRAITYPNNSQEQFNYDPLGNLTESINRRGHPIRYSYDARGLVSRKDYADGSHVDFTYDDRGNMRTATDMTGITTLDWDSTDRLRKITYPSGRFLRFSYDRGGSLRTQMVDQDGFTVNYIYDDAGRLTELRDGQNNLIVQYSYDLVGRLQRKDLGNRTYTTYEYDPAGELLHLVNYAPDGTVNSRFDYQYDELGRRTSMTTLEGRWDYEYDITGQLTLVRLPNGRTIQYAYDAAGNRTSVTDQGVPTSYTTNNLDQYLTVGTASYTYDLDGNLISVSDGAQTWNYSYDDENQLVRAFTPQGIWGYEYDAFGNRSAASHDGQRTQYLVDPFRFADAVAEYNGAGNLTARYVYALGLTSRIDVANGAAYYYDFDAIGSTVGITGSAGSYLNRYSYLPFGERLTSNETIANPFAFVGEWGVMAESNGLMFMRARFYQAGSGRFLSPDPLGIPGENSHTYVANDPIGFIDPEGLLRIRIFGFDITILQGSGEGRLLRIERAFGNETFHYTATGGAAGRPHQGMHAAVRTGTSYVHYYQGRAYDAVARSAAQGNLRTFFARSLSRASVYLGRVALAGGRLLLAGGRFVFFRVLPVVGWALLAWDIGWAIGTAIRVGIFGAEDPNDLIGPAGYGADRFVRPDQTFPYKIRFENEASANAPAQVVRITHRLDSNLDFDTFELGEFGFGSVTVQVPAGRTFFHTRIDLRSKYGVYVDVTANFDVATGLATWLFMALDPLTLDLVSDPLAGFLPPNQNPPEGEGFVTYRIRPRITLGTGTRIDARATVIFDDNDPVDTPRIHNTIDAGPPTSHINPLPAVSPPSFTVSWSGQDDVGGSGIAFFDIYVSDNDGAFTLWLGATTQTSAIFTGVVGHHYGFYSRATDNVGHREAEPMDAQATTIVQAPGPVTHFRITASASIVPAGTPFTLTVTALDDNGLVVTGYTGTVRFTTSDMDPGVLLPADYTFTVGPDGDNGVHTFTAAVTLYTVGDQTITVADVNDPMITGTASVTVGGGAPPPPSGGRVPSPPLRMPAPSSSEALLFTWGRSPYSPLAPATLNTVTPNSGLSEPSRESSDRLFIAQQENIGLALSLSKWDAVETAEALSRVRADALFGRRRPSDSQNEKLADDLTYPVWANSP